MHIIPTKEHHSKNNFSLGYGSNNDRLQKKKWCALKKDHADTSDNMNFGFSCIIIKRYFNHQK